MLLLLSSLQPQLCSFTAAFTCFDSCKQDLCIVYKEAVLCAADCYFFDLVIVGDVYQADAACAFSLARDLADLDSCIVAKHTLYNDEIFHLGIMDKDDIFILLGSCDHLTKYILVISRNQLILTLLGH